MNYYNEFDPHAAQWLRNLIEAGAIPPGFVDTRSIEDVTPNELVGYTQCHFFAGIGGWVYALDLAGWPRDRPVWTGSCPCQPFSAAGKGAGFEDERHLWPAWQHLIAQCRPPVVFGEQVASKAVDAWIDLVHADMEGMGYAFGSVPFPAAGVGAPHIRDRTFWVAYSEHRGRKTRESERTGASAVVPSGIAEFLANLHGDGRDQARQRVASSRCNGVVGNSPPGRMADALLQQRPDGEPRVSHEHDAAGRVEGAATATGLRGYSRPGPVNGFWRDADWLLCRDGKWRPVEPGTFPLAHGVSGRVGLLRGYGNAIVPQAAAEFVIAFMQSTQRAALLDAA